MIADELQKLHDEGKLKRFASVGIIPVKVLTQFEMYLHYTLELENNRRCNDCIMKSASNTADKFRVSDRTVFRAIEFCQSE